jgi:hypothetical protein
MIFVRNTTYPIWRSLEVQCPELSHVCTNNQVGIQEKNLRHIKWKQDLCATPCLMRMPDSSTNAGTCSYSE